MELLEKVAEFLNLKRWEYVSNEYLAQTVDKLYQAHFAGMTPEEVKLTDEKIDNIWNSPTNKTMQIEVPHKQFGKLIKQVKNISAQIAQAQLAKASAYYETKIEQVRKEERERILRVIQEYHCGFYRQSDNVHITMPQGIWDSLTEQALKETK